MPIATASAYLVLVITSATLLYAAFNDLQKYEIRNELVIALAVLFLVYALASGRWTTAHWNVGFALLMFGLMLIPYSLRWLGGGDVKLLTVAFLWSGPDCALLFALLLAAAAAVHVGLFGLGIVEGTTTGVRRIPFAPSVAVALIAVFLWGCLQQAP
jgi:prepilin peptidase CpaA